MKRILLFITVLVLGYCSWGALFGPLMFDVMVWNTSKSEYNDVRVRFERFDFQFGILSRKTWAVYSQQIGPWPESITVSWIVRGKPEQALIEEIKLAGPLDIQSNESLELVVEFKNGGPVAYPRARGDESTRWRRRYKD